MNTRDRLIAAAQAAGKLPIDRTPPLPNNPLRKRRRPPVQEPLDIEFEIHGDYPGLDCEVICNDCQFIRRKETDLSSFNKARTHSNRSGHSVRVLKLGVVVRTLTKAPKVDYSGPPPF